jgi:hypothetical protein
MDHRKTYAAVFVVAASTLVLEILMTRITSVLAWYHLAFFVISLAMLGMTAGAVFVFVRPARYTDEQIPHRLWQSSVWLAASTPLATAAALAIPLSPISDMKGFLAMLAYGIALGIPFTLSGIVLTLALTRAGLPAGRVYGVDLVGAAAGCVLVIPVLQVVDAPSGVLIAAAGAAVAAALFAAARSDGRARSDARISWGLAAGLLFAGAANASMDSPVLRPHYVKGAAESQASYEFSGWNTYSRVTVDRTIELPPVLWAPSRLAPIEWARPIRQRGIKIDGAAGTTMAAFDTRPDDGLPGDPSQHGYLTWDVTSFAHLLRPTGAAAVIGVGGGRDVLEAVRVGHDPVVGIELNDLIVKLHTDTMREFSGIADLPQVRLVGDEARSFLVRDAQRYQVITMSLIDTWAATGAGAYALSENGLYTVEGWRVFMSRLDRGGIFTVSRWYKPDSPGETARMLALAMETLYGLGVEHPRRHIMLLQNLSIATLLVSRDPFTEADIDRLQKEAVIRGFNMLLTPRRVPANPLLRELIEQPTREDLWRFARSQTLDLTPPTDERPFFFNMLRPATWLSQPDTSSDLDFAFLGNLHATQTLVYATLVSALLTLMAIAVPLWSRRKALAAYPKTEVIAACLYFALIGLGFMFVEMGLLSRLNVFLGHPTLALAVLLGGIILFTGVGSLQSGRIDPTRGTLGRLFPLIPAALVLAAALALDPLMRANAAGPTSVRVLVGIALVGVPALGMGLCFPLGLRLVDTLHDGDQPELGPWMWGVNGACGVVASGLALTSSMAWGIATTLRIGAGCYVALLLCTFVLQRAASRRS